jgi:hypothetical protein
VGKYVTGTCSKEDRHGKGRMDAKVVRQPAM